MTGLPGKILALHAALDDADLAHAFGGALALAWCTERARGTIGIDLNVFIDHRQAARVVAALPPAVVWTDDDLDILVRDGQARLWFDTTPVDLFLDTTAFHAQVARRARWEEFAGERVPFVSCSDLAVFKVFFNRTKDWADLEEMIGAGTLDIDRVLGILVRYIDADDPRLARFRSLSGV